MMYLPSGAHVIMIGPANDQESKKQRFQEVDQCFKFLGYLHFHRYDSDPSECKERYQRWFDPAHVDLKNLARLRWWDTDRYPQPQLIGDMIASAAKTIEVSKVVGTHR